MEFSEEYYHASHPVVVSLSDLRSGASDDKLPLAFGPNSLGIVLVSGMPEEYVRLRESVLLSASRLAHLPQDVLASMEVPQAQWLVGWSRGREKLEGSGDKPDTQKGSFYVNCAFHTCDDLEAPPSADVKGYEKGYEIYTHSNVWPPEDLEFKRNLKDLCNLMIDTAAVVAAACDRLFGGKLPGYEKGHLEHIVSTSTTTKARLLHYFPSKPDEDIDPEEGSTWCGEHTDHSCITALTAAMYFDDSLYPLVHEIQEQFPGSGLHVRNRRGETVHVKIPPDCLAFQTGSALEETTSGRFKAVPHRVARGKLPAGVCRNTLAVFCQPALGAPVGPRYSDFATFARSVVERNHQ
ncbi:uncharacterized protein SAPINGB_P001403 [Magnusiomyces paraingens]|uniref:Isopenicillin N synthase-like Fe(2+) 2OG dioxygenase domain-containing protein n=1 Tax=Magnusiomyces paraingens TaxID=2606893 RepID=A0A5E8B7P4_9ASCO|nr:uncharacterized protein SAPINGB_P001403 [Saprochaete ingens]VVT46821.1 unnamed protein product [Saprochaete ingens]